MHLLALGPQITASALSSCQEASPAAFVLLFQDSPKSVLAGKHCSHPCEILVLILD